MRNLNLNVKGTEKRPVRVAENHNSRRKEASKEQMQETPANASHLNVWRVEYD